MAEERHWIAGVPEETYVNERLYAHDVVRLPVSAGHLPSPGDPVALVAVSDEPKLFGLGRAQLPGSSVRYTRRLLDQPLPVQAEVAAGLRQVSRAEYDRLTALVAPSGAAGRAEWFVTVALPIEAPSPAEAVREFWTYVGTLGPRELPAFVWPRGDELAMQTYVLGEPANQDPEEDD